MARLTVRYLVRRPGAGDALPRYFWQPSSALRAQGWRPERVPLDWSRHTDPAALEAAAIARAMALNAELDSARTTAPADPSAPPATRTLGELVRLYQAGEHWTKKLRPATRRGYRQCMDKLLDAWGEDAPVRAIDPVRVRRLHARLAATPAFANAVMRALRLLLEFARGEGWVGTNAAIKPPMATIEPGGVIWPAGAVAAFVATADAMGLHSMGTAVLLNEWLGQREGDIIRMPWSILRNEALVLRQSKTGATVSLPVGMVPALVCRLAEERARQDARAAEAAAIAARCGQPPPVASTAIIVAEATGRPFKPDNFRHVFARVRAKLAESVPGFDIDYLLPGRDMTDPAAFTVATADLTFMTLRHTAVTRLAEAGCTTGQIINITGHALASAETILKRYMVRTAQIARGAFQRRLDAEAPAAAVEKKGDVG